MQPTTPPLDYLPKFIYEGDHPKSNPKAEFDPYQAYNSTTIREREVWCFLALGLSNKEVASRLGTSAKTVENQRTGLYKKIMGTLPTGVARLTIMAVLHDMISLSGYGFAAPVIKGHTQLWMTTTAEMIAGELSYHTTEINDKDPAVWIPEFNRLVRKKEPGFAHKNPLVLIHAHKIDHHTAATIGTV